MAERINVRREIVFFLLVKQADPRFAAFEKQANQADCGEARFIVELLRETYAMKPQDPLRSGREPSSIPAGR